jgi:hypothetical protein
VFQQSPDRQQRSLLFRLFRRDSALRPQSISFTSPSASRAGRWRAGLIAASICLGGCVTHQHTVGLGPTGTGESSVRQYYIFFGLMQLNEVNVQRMSSDLTSYSIDTRFSFTDLLFSPFLLPFTVTSRTVTVHK